MLLRTTTPHKYWPDATFFGMAHGIILSEVELGLTLYLSRHQRYKDSLKKWYSRATLVESYSTTNPYSSTQAPAETVFTERLNFFFTKLQYNSPDKTAPRILF